jgi:hypothetical protein
LTLRGQPISSLIPARWTAMNRRTACHHSMSAIWITNEEPETMESSSSWQEDRYESGQNWTDGGVLREAVMWSASMCLLVLVLVIAACLLASDLRGKNEKSITKKVTEYPGWHSTTDDKTELLGEYRRVLASGEFVNRSREAIAECRSYVVATNGVPCHSAALDDSDPTGARDNHGDRVIADALCVRGMREVSPKVIEHREAFPPSSFGWRMEKRRRSRAEERYVL